MALVEKTGGPRTHVGHSEPEALAADVETTPLAEHTQPRLNGSINTRVEGPPEDHVIVAFFKSYGAVIIAATFGVIGSGDRTRTVSPHSQNTQRLTHPVSTERIVALHLIFVPVFHPNFSCELQD